MAEEEEEKWVKSIENQSNEEAWKKLESWLLPKTDGFFQAPSGHRLHVRAVLPPGDAEALSVKAIVLYCHGMNSHVNARNFAGELYPSIAAAGFAIFALDIMGHGYSEGQRVLVEDWHLVFTDWEAFAEALLGVAEPRPSPAEFCAGVPDEVLARIRSLPVFVNGMSMGGMIGMYLGLRLQENERLRDRFSGACLTCPSLVVDLPPKAVQWFLLTLVVPLFRTCAMPAAVSSSSKSKLSWAFDLSDPRQRHMAEMEIHDCAVRFPGRALGHHQGMLWGTAGAFSKLFSTIEEDMKRVQFHLLLIHDPADRVCFFSGSQRLMELCRSKDKTLQEVDAGGRHCIPMIKQDWYVSSVTSWYLQHL